MMRMKRELTLAQLTFFPRLFPVNCYLIEEEDGLTLIDAALSVSLKGILQAARLIGKPIVRIALTHAHGDHVGALDGLKRQLPDAPVLISVRDARLMRADSSLDPGEPQRPIRGGLPKKLQTRPDVLLKDGDRIGSLTAVSVPGHTPGSMAFYDERTGFLIAGDAMQTRGGIAVSGQMVPWFPFPAMATWDKQTALDSVRKLRELQPSMLAVGHGDLLPNPLQAIDRAIAQAELRLNGKPTQRSV